MSEHSGALNSHLERPISSGASWISLEAPVRPLIHLEAPGSSYSLEHPRGLWSLLEPPSDSWIFLELLANSRACYTLPESPRTS